MVRFTLAHGGILALALLICGCDQKPKVAEGPTPNVRPDDNSHHGGGVTTELPARTGSEASGVEGSSTVIGAPPKGQTGLATAHGAP
jgi:hypothetical protein